MYDQTKKSSHVHNIRKFMILKNDAVVRTTSALEFDFASTLNTTQTLKSIFHNQLIYLIVLKK